MKNIIIVLVFAVSFTTVAQNKNAKASIEVDGVCMMCKDRIEKAAVKAIGVKSAIWNMDTHELRLIFNEKKTDLTKIQQSIANVGHDTPDFRALDEVYNAIDDCCKYRDPEVLKDHGIEVKDDGGH